MIRRRARSVVVLMTLVLALGGTASTGVVAKDRSGAGGSSTRTVPAEKGTNSTVDPCREAPPPPALEPPGPDASEAEVEAYIQSRAEAQAREDYDWSATPPPPPPPALEPHEDDCVRSFGITGTVASEPKGITLSGRACSLEQPFEVKSKGDILGTITFRPSGEAAGLWSYKGKPFNAPFKVVGSGGYSLGLAEEGTAGSLDLDFVLTIKIPGVGNQTSGGPLSLTLTAALPCGQGGS